MDPARLALALEQLRSIDGFVFEEFANAFLVSELPDLRPVGGLHDEGRDAFLHRSDGVPTTFVQHSVTTEWQKKIRDTIKTLIANGHKVVELIYCSPKDVQRHAGDLKRELRAAGVILDVRDRGWFVANLHSGPSQVAASERIARLKVDPLLAEKLPASSDGILDPESERLAITYLQIELNERAPDRNLTKLCYQTLVVYALRLSDIDRPMRFVQIVEEVGRLIKHQNRADLELYIRNAIDLLVKRKQLRHHTKEAAYVLAHPQRMELRAKREELLLSEARLVHESAGVVEAVALDLGVDFSFDATDVAHDALFILDRIIMNTGRLAALAMTGHGAFHCHGDTVTEAVEKLVKHEKEALRSLSALGVVHFFDFVPEVVRRLGSHPSEDALQRMRNASEAYLLRFVLQETPDVQRALREVVGSVDLLVDASIIVAAMCEVRLPALHQRTTSLLRFAASIGCGLFVHDDIVNELETHLDRIAGYDFKAHGGRGARTLHSGLQRAYLDAQVDGYRGSFADFLEQFRGRSDPRRDLLDYLSHELGIHHRGFEEQEKRLPHPEETVLYERWSEVKRRNPWVSEDAFLTLVRHDVRAFMLVPLLRDLERHTYGHKWWWLVRDGTAFQMDREMHATGRQPVAMSPDFFARYLALAPRVQGEGDAKAEAFSSCLEVASLNLVPVGLREEAEQAYEATKGQPEYLRRRRLRDLANQARFQKSEST